MGYYIRSRAADWVLCICLTASLTAAFCSGFPLDGGLSDYPAAVFAVSAVLQALLLLIAYDRLTTAAGITAGVLFALAVVFFMHSRYSLTGELPGGTFLFLLIGTVTAILVFLLSRTRPGTAVLFLAGTLIQAGCHFLAFPAPLWAFLLFPAASLILFFYRTYTVSLLEADLGKVRASSYLRQAVLVCLAALAVGGGVYLGVVRPLDPPVQDLKLIQVLRSMPVLEVLGVSSTEIVLDPELTSQTPPGEEESGGEEGEEDDGGMAGQQPESQPAETDSQEDQTQSTLQQLTAVRYDGDTARHWWLLLLIPLLIAGAFVLRVALRRRWHRRVQGLPRREAVQTYYRFFLSRLEKIGLKRMRSHTLREYVSHIELPLQAFDAGGYTFAMLTSIYEKALYGCCPIQDAEYQAYEVFYAQFYRNLRREAGAGKYYLQIFRF